MKIGNREKVLLFILAIIIVVALTFLLLIMPTMNDTKELESQIATKETEQKTRKDEIAMLPLLKGQEKKLLEEKAMQKAFFMPYDEKLFSLEGENIIIQNLLMSNKEGCEFNFQKANMSNSFDPKPHPEVNGLYKVEFIININSKDMPGITLGEYFNFKKNLENNDVIKSVCTGAERIFYQKDSASTIEESLLVTADIEVIIFLKGNPIVEETTESK